MTTAIRYGIIGAGTMGQEHIRNIALTPGAEVAAIADPHAASIEGAAALAGPGATVHADYRDLLADEKLDAVVVGTPNHTHARVLEDVLATPLHVLVEKPLCTTVADCRAVAAAVGGRRGLVWVAMEYRYMPPVARLIGAVRDGAVGRLHMLAIREHRHPFLVKVGDWNRFARNTGGTMVEKCCHFFDLMRLIVGQEPVRVFASGSQDVNHLDEVYDGARADIVDNAYTIVEFEGGARAMLDLCMFADASRNQEEISVVGDAAKVECFVPSSELVTARRATRTIETEIVPVPADALEAGAHHGSTFYQHLAFQKAIRTGGAPAVTVEDGLMAVAMGVAAERSIAEGRPVAMSEMLA